MTFKEVIDSPVDESDFDLPQRQLAKLVSLEIHKYAIVEASSALERLEDNELPDDSDTPTIEASRVVSWVESDNSITGHALVLAGIQKQRQKTPLFTAYYYEVNRNTHKVEQDSAQGIALPISTPENRVSNEEYADSLAEVFSRGQLIYIRQMFAKLVKLHHSNQPIDEKVDSHVLKTLLEDNIEGLATLSTPTKRQEIAKLAENIFLDLGVIEALRTRYSTEIDQNKDMTPLLGLTIKRKDGDHFVICEYNFNSLGKPVPAEVTVIKIGKDSAVIGDSYDYQDISGDQEFDHVWDRDAVEKTILHGQRMKIYDIELIMQEYLVNR